MEIIRNLQEIRDRKAGIQHDFLALLDVELTVFGRNREHTIYLSLETRDKLRKFMNACAIKRAEITNFLAEFYKQNALADQLTASGQAPQGQRVKNDALLILNNANSAADQLFQQVREGEQLLKPTSCQMRPSPPQAAMASSAAAFNWSASDWGLGAENTFGKSIHHEPSSHLEASRWALAFQPIPITISSVAVFQHDLEVVIEIVLLDAVKDTVASTWLPLVKINIPSRNFTGYLTLLGLHPKVPAGTKVHFTSTKDDSERLYKTTDMDEKDSVVLGARGLGDGSIRATHRGLRAAFDYPPDL